MWGHVTVSQSEILRALYLLQNSAAAKQSMFPCRFILGLFKAARFYSSIAAYWFPVRWNSCSHVSATTLQYPCSKCQKFLRRCQTWRCIMKSYLPPRFTFQSAPYRWGRACQQPLSWECFEQPVTAGVQMQKQEEAEKWLRAADATCWSSMAFPATFSDFKLNSATNKFFLFRSTQT